MRTRDFGLLLATLCVAAPLLGQTGCTKDNAAPGDAPYGQVAPPPNGAPAGAPPMGGQAPPPGPQAGGAQGAPGMAPPGPAMGGASGPGGPKMGGPGGPGGAGPMMGGPMAGGPMMGDPMAPLTPTPELDKDIAAATKKGDKKAIAAAYASRGYERMTDDAAGARIKYRKALEDFRVALQNDPANPKAKENKQRIEDIYRSMGRPIPGEEGGAKP